MLIYCKFSYCELVCEIWVYEINGWFQEYSDYIKVLRYARFYLNEILKFQIVSCLFFFDESIFQF